MIIKTHKIILIFNTKTFLHNKSIFVDLLTTQNSEMRFFPSLMIDYINNPLSRSYPWKRLLF